MPLKEQKYKRNQAILKNYGNRKLRITHFNTLRTSGIEDKNKKYTTKGSVNKEKLEENIIRAKSKIYELAICNDWELFATFTLNKEKYNRYDLDKFVSDFSREFLKSYNRKHKLKIKYFVIPEKHKDGAWHLHGFFMGLPIEHLKEFNEVDYIELPPYILKKIRKGEKVYDWLPYVDKFGWCDLEPIKNHEACSKYVTKYIVKDLSKSVTEVGAHLYYCSQGLNRAMKIKQGYMIGKIIPDYENEYCRVKTVDYTDENLKNLEALIYSKVSTRKNIADSQNKVD